MDNIKWRRSFNRINNVSGGDGLQMLSVGAGALRGSGRQADKALPCQTRKL